MHVSLLQHTLLYSYWFLNLFRQYVFFKSFIPVCVGVAGVFRGNKAQVKEYQELLDPIIFQSYEGE